MWKYFVHTEKACFDQTLKMPVHEVNYIPDLKQTVVQGTLRDMVVLLDGWLYFCFSHLLSPSWFLERLWRD